MSDRDFDSAIRRALEGEVADLSSDLDDQSLFQKVRDSFRGRQRWLTIMVYGYVWVFSAAMIYCGYRFYGAAGAESVIRWGGAFLFCALVVLFSKVWYWQELNKNSVLREVKRVELRLAALAAKLGSTPQS